MANDLAGLQSKLSTALRDVGSGNGSEWTTAEQQEVVTEAVNTLYPRFSRQLDPTANTITFVALTYHYALPAGVRAVSRVDRVSSASVELGPMQSRAWEVVGDHWGSPKLHVAPTIVDGDVGGTLRIHGYGVYDVTTNLIPDIFIPLVLARARAEAYRRALARRQNSQNWLTVNQVQNVSVTELIHGINEADAEANRLEQHLPRTWQLPVPGRIG